ncbi:hypothetical protein ACFQU7_39405 [Pseudoroseomonas wenyumeiae]
MRRGGLGEQAGDDIRRAAGRRGQDDADGSVRQLGLGDADQPAEEQGREEQHGAFLP